MKELYILSDSYVPSSASTNHLFAYAKGIAENGVSVTMFFLHPYHHREKYEGSLHPNIQIEYIWDGLAIKNKYLRYLKAVRVFYKKMKPETPVFVSGSSSILFLLRKKKDIKLYHERTENPKRIKGVMGGLYERTIPELDGMFVITPSLRQLFIDDYKIAPDKIFVTNMVVDTNRFQGLEKIEPTKTISYCGTMTEWKDGVSYLVKAFAIVNKKYPEYELVLMGAFEDKENEILIRSLIDNLHIRDKVRLMGVVPVEEMPFRLKRSGILALSRPRQKEKAIGFATKIGEYLLSERPVVMTDVGDVSYYLKDGENVILAEPNDEVNFAEKLLWVIEHPEESEFIGKSGSEAAIKHFNYKTEAKKIVDAIFG